MSDTQALIERHLWETTRHLARAAGFSLGGMSDQRRTKMLAFADYVRRDERQRAADTIARLEAERDAAQADAARYRWLRDVAWNEGELCFYAERYGNEEWDARIDAAIRAAMEKP